MGKSTHTTRTPRVSREALEAARESLIESATAYILANNPADLTPFRVWDVIDAHGRGGNLFYARLPESGRGKRADELLQDVIASVDFELRIKALIARTIDTLLTYTLDPVSNSDIYLFLDMTAHRHKLPRFWQRDARYPAIAKAVREGYEQQAAALRSEIVKPLDSEQRAILAAMAGSFLKIMQVGEHCRREIADALTRLGFTEYENDVTFKLTRYGLTAAAIRG